MLFVSTDGVLNLLCSAVWLKGNTGSSSQMAERGEYQPVSNQFAQKCKGKHRLQIPRSPFSFPLSQDLFYPSLYSFFLINIEIQSPLDTASKPGGNTAVAATAMSWRTQKTITFSLGKPNTHQGSNVPVNVSAFFPESSFCFRISSLTECPCMNGRQTGQASNHKLLEQDPNVFSSTARDIFSWCWFRSALCWVPKQNPGLSGAGSRSAARCRAPGSGAGSAQEAAALPLECLCALCTIRLFAGLLMEMAFGCVLLSHCTSKWSNTSSLGFKAKGRISVILIYI